MNIGPFSPETGELWPTILGIYRKPFGRATRPPNFVSLSSKKVGLN